MTRKKKNALLFLLFDRLKKEIAATAPGPVSIRGAGPYKPPTPLPLREFTPIPCAVSRRSSRVGRGGLAESAGGYRLLSSRGH